ncbi:MAG: peptidoglycan bridge formation glycyltransferase FemA/FemB family protein [Candidatus Levyibacteriota bacterium]|nr:MAG: peptidoglycan bridge formation glycyltransferase FemA/FemB family protein [Candidatus Levybacteria bacterium]
MYEIRDITKKKIWDDFLLQKEVVFYPFFQAWEWGEVQRRMARSVWRVGVFDEEKLVAVCQIVKVVAKRGTYLHLRHGPVLLPFDWEVFDEIINYSKKLAAEERASFIRISPVVPKEYVDFANLKKRGFRDSAMHNMDAEICWVLDITKPENELLKEMRKSHRYLIKKALGMGIKIMVSKDTVDLTKFFPLYQDLSKRKHFVPHKGVQEEFDVFAKNDEELLFLATYNGKVISGAIIAFVGKMAIYRHGASDNEFRDIPASYLIQWEAMREAKKRGMAIYNFWGIASNDRKTHPWYGLSLFKMGFGGKRLEFLHAQDLPLTFSYWKTNLIERISTWRKGYF